MLGTWIEALPEPDEAALLKTGAPQDGDRLALSSPAVSS